MNNLKFRAYFEQYERMIDNIGIINQNMILVDFTNSGELEPIFITDKIHVMQSTGLKDKNGKEIFEGDIVNYEFCDFRPNVASYETGGKYVTGYKKAVLWKNGKFICNDYDLLHICEDIEVIGNIYENKELIENEI